MASRETKQTCELCATTAQLPAERSYWRWRFIALDMVSPTQG